MLKGENMLGGKKYGRLLTICVVAFFAAALIIGVAVSGDYTTFGDAESQRQHGLINYEYLSRVFTGETVPEIREMDFPMFEGDEEKFPELETYAYRHYGVTLQLPMVAVEAATDFTMPLSEVHHYRNIYTFLIYFCALIAFFFLLKDLFKSGWLALAGTALMYLFPLFFATSMVNIKDTIFISMIIISCFFMVRMFKSGRKLKYCVLFALFSALTVNSRVLGAFVLVGAVAFMLAEDIIAAKSKNSEIKAELAANGNKRVLGAVLPYIIIVLGTIGFYILLTPACWSGLGSFMSLASSSAMDYEWNNLMPFMGRLGTWAQMPWYYLPVYMAITIPVFTLAMFIAGTGFLIGGLFGRGSWLRFVKNRYVWLFAVLFFAPLLFQMAAHVKIYLGWRHMYMLFVPLCVISVYGIKRLYERFAGSGKRAFKAIIPIAVAAAVAIGAARIIIDHPYEMSMYNAFGIPIAEQNYRNGRLAYKGCYEYLLEAYPEGKIELGVTPYLEALSAEDAERFAVAKEGEPIDFYIETYREAVGDVELPGYEEVYSVEIDGYKIATVFRREDYGLEY